MRPLIAGNWKMHGTAPQLREIASIASVVRMTRPGAEFLFCPPLTLITRAVQAAAGRITIGGQNCASEISGAFTESESPRAAGYEIEDYGAYQVHRAHFSGALATNVVW
jgi:triosephosphate isomerase